MSESRLKFEAGPIVLLTLLMISCNSPENTPAGAARPRVVSPPEVSKVLRAIPNYTRFGYSGLCFFNHKLYASSNIGLLEFNEGALSRLYKWHDRDDVISGPWLDVASKSVWIIHYGIGKLVRYTGNDWQIMELPRPREGYTRGDILSGFRGTGTSGGFWLEGGGHAWRWNSKNSAWEAVTIPQDGSLVRIIPLPKIMLMAMRHEPLPFLAKEEAFETDTIHYYEGWFKEVPNKTGKRFFAEQIVVIKDGAYVLTNKGLILRVTQSEIAKIDALDDCEAIAATTAGSLLVSFRNSGVYEYTGDGWQKRFSSPYSSTEAEHWAYLAESGEQVAFAITSMPQGYGESTKYPGQTTLWVSKDGELKVVPIGEP